MSTDVNTYLERIEGGKESIVTSIKNKGVAVPDDATIDELSPYVDAIASAVLQSKTVTPKTTSQTVIPDADFDGLSKVTVNAIPNQKTASDVTVSGATVTTPAGYYPSKVEKSVATMGEKIYTVSLDHPIINIDVGYHDDTTAQIVRETEKTVTPSKDGTTISPASGKVLSTVTVLGDANLVAGNIKKGVSIFGVTGTFEGGVSIATCTVNITFSTNQSYRLVSATTFANGEISAFNLNDRGGTGTISIPNVVCGSAISVSVDTMIGVYGWSYGFKLRYDANGGTLTAPSTSGTYSVEIGVVDD